MKRLLTSLIVLTNIFAVSCSHIAFGSIRMEPVFMILGQSASVMAVKAIEQKKDVADIKNGDVRPVLLEYGQILEFSEN